MNNHIYITDLLKIAVPALLVLGAVWLVLDRLGKSFREKLLAGAREKSRDQLLARKLQAYERLTLFVERITPVHLLVRMHQAGMSARELNALLAGEIRAEFEHNLVQQLYLSERSWQAVKDLKDRTVAMINGIARRLPEEAGGMELTKEVLGHLEKLEEDPYRQALSLLKEEVRELF